MSRIRLDRGELPWAPLVPGGEGLNRYPEEPVALRARMAEVYGVPIENLAVIDGAASGKRLVRWWLGPDAEVADESWIEFDDVESRASEAMQSKWLMVVRDLSKAYGLAGAPCGALIGTAENVALIRERFGGLSEPVVRLSMLALDPSRTLATKARVAVIVAERDRMCAELNARPYEGNQYEVQCADKQTFARFGIDVDWPIQGLARFGIDPAKYGIDPVPVDPIIARVTVGTPEQNDFVLAAMGVVTTTAPHRTATVVRDTKETRIVATVDLDRAGTREVHTGIGFFDHMLDQVAAHGGFGLTLAVEGDLHIDPHHSIEDATLALGAALKQALGDRAGIGRYGFVLPMDEAEARISIDLGGRPFSVFEGSFHASHIGEYPTALTAHVFRSLAESMGAAIHMHVTGEDDHHKTEACFKALGRALRQAIRVEGGDVPSTKGVL